MEAPESVAVLRFSSLGDVVLTAPALDALRSAWPRTRIFFVTKERFRPLVAHHPAVTEVVGLVDGESAFRLARRLRELKTGVVLDLHGKIRSRVVHALMPGVPWVTWHKRDFKDTVAVRLGKRPYRVSMRQSDRYHAAAEALVGHAVQKGRLSYHLGPSDRDDADAVLRAVGIDLTRPLVGISPGAAMATKRWPADRYGALAARLIAGGFQVAAQGSAEEESLVAQVCAAAPGTANLAGKLGLTALGGFISRCAAFVTNDTGPMHIARGLGVPTLAVFGSTDPGMFEFEGHAVLFAGVPCAPCSFFGREQCPEGHFKCMLDLTADRAWSALQPLLGGRRLPLVSG